MNVNAVIAYPTPPAGDSANIVFVENVAPTASSVDIVSTGGISIAGLYELNPHKSSIDVSSTSAVALSSLPRNIDAIFNYPAPPAGNAADIAFLEELIPSISSVDIESASAIFIAGLYELNPHAAMIGTLSISNVAITTLPRLVNAVLAYPAPQAGNAADLAFIESMRPDSSNVVVNSINIGKPAYGQGIEWGEDIRWGGVNGLRDISDTNLAWHILNQRENLFFYILFNALELEVSYKIFNQDERDFAWQILAGFIEYAFGWHVENDTEREISWKLQNASENMFAWHVQNGIELEFMYYVIADPEAFIKFAVKIINQAEGKPYVITPRTGITYKIRS